MRNKKQKIVACPISKSSNHDEFNDICKATGQPCPYFADEGMSVCKSKVKCLLYFSKRLTKVNFKEVVNLIFSDTQPKTKVAKTSRSKHKTPVEEMDKANEASNAFIEDLEDALKKHEEENIEEGQDENEIDDHIMAIEESMKKM